MVCVVAELVGGEKVEELWEALSAGGFIGVNIPEEYGGGGMGIYELSIVCEELAVQGLPLLILIVSPAIAGSIITKFGTDGQKQRWLPGIASGERRIAFAITEPDAGSNSHRLSTTAKRDGDVYRLNGQKYYISAVDEADELCAQRLGTVDHPLQHLPQMLAVSPVEALGLHQVAFDRGKVLATDQPFVDALQGKFARPAAGAAPALAWRPSFAGRLRSRQATPLRTRFRRPRRASTSGCPSPPPPVQRRDPSR